MSEPLEYLIKKGAYFYRPNSQGYTSFKFDAGRYTKAEAEAEAAIEPWHMKAIHQDDVPEETAPDKAFSEMKKTLDHWRHEVGKLHSQIARKDAEIERLLKLAAPVLSTLTDCEEYFDNRADADCDQDGFIPNEEMRMLTAVREAIAKAVSLAAPQ